MKIQVILLAFFALFFSQKSSAQFCRQPNPQSSSAPLAYGTIANWQPVTNIVIPVNFIFLKPPSGPSMFDTVTDASCHYLLNFYNLKFANLQPPTLPLPPPNTAPFISDAKITFVFKSRQHVASSDYNNPAASGTNAWPVYTPSDTTALNIVFNANLYHGNTGSSKGIPSQVVYILADHFQANPFWNFLNNGVMHMHVHEIGHALGLEHTGPHSGNNKFGTVLPPPPVDDYWYEDSRQWEKYNDSANIADNYPDSANNIMGYTWPARSYLSPKQIAYMHYTYWTSSVWKNTPSCSLSNSWIMGGNNTLAGLVRPPGDIIIPYGAHMTITGIVQMKQGAKIVVEPHGKLSINGGLIINACGQSWKGIELQAQSAGIQTVNLSTGMPSGGVGMLSLNGARIINAEIGVFIGTKLGSNQVAPLSGGGILNCVNSQFLNNRISIQFSPYSTSAFSPLSTDNISSISNSEFIINPSYGQSQPADAAIVLNSTFKVEILGCLFKNWKPMTAIGIKNFNGSFILKNYVGNSIVRSRFEGFKHAIYSTNWLLNSPSVIRNAIFNTRDSISSPNNIFNYSLGNIYMMNNFGSEITGCEFYNLRNIFNNGTNGSMTYGIYLDHCDGYVVENNYFEGNPNTNNQNVGAIFINESGPGANSVYNNVIKYYAQGIWAQNVNYNPVTGAGLVMNCNDFTSVTHNIGVQSQFTGAFCLNCPIPQQSGGVSTTQGVVNPLNQEESVRNTYHSNINCSAENKFYVNTPNNAFSTTHGSFLGNQYHPTPQPSCSNGLEVIDLVSPFGPQGQKSLWCPVTNYGNKTSSELLAEFSTVNANIDAIKSTLVKVDGGNGRNLLQMIAEGHSAARIKDSLLTKTYISDTLLKAYLSMPGNTYQSYRQIIELNSPLPLSVWEHLSNFTLEPSQRAYLDSLQFSQNKLNERVKLESELTLKINKHGLIGNERIRRFLIDSVPQIDSALYVIANGFDPEREFKALDLLITAGRYSAAAAKIDQLSSKPSNIPFCTVMSYIMALQNDSCKIQSLAADTIVRNNLHSFLTSNDRRLEGYAKVLLYQVFGETIVPVTMSPSSAIAGARTTQNTENVMNAVAETELLSSSVILVPNPTSGRFTLKGINSKSEIELHIRTTTNALVETLYCKGDCELNLSALPTGIYFVHLIDKGQLLSVKKLVLIK